MSNTSIKREVVLLDSAGAAVGEWIRLDTKYSEGDNRAVQGTVAAGTLNIEGTTKENLGGPPFGQAINGRSGFMAPGAWIYPPNWTLNLLGNNTASSDGTQTAASNLTQPNHLIEEGSTYTLTFTVSNFSAGTITPILSGTGGTPRAANGTFTETLIAGDQFHRLTLSADAAFIGDITDVSLVLDVPAADIGILQSYNADFTDVVNSSWTYIRAVKIGAGAAKVQGMV